MFLFQNFLREYLLHFLLLIIAFYIIGKYKFKFCPDGASIKKKMLYASSAQAIKSTLGTERILQFQVYDFFDILLNLDFLWNLKYSIAINIQLFIR